MIRKVKNTEIERIYTLGTIMHPNFRNTYDLKTLLEKDYFNILVYEENKTILGFIIYQELADGISIDDLFVLEKYRNKHIATNLIDMLITNSSVNAAIYLEVRKDNQVAVDLYKKFGFKIARVRKNYYGDCDAYIMERKRKNE